MPEPHLLVVSGPPAAGKTVVSTALAELIDRSMVVPIDEIRLWVKSGRSEPLPEWTDETALQFQLAEDSAADVASRYWEAGFSVILDHCRLPANIDAFCQRCFAERRVVKVALVPPLELVLIRNAQRSNKDFDPRVLEPVIRGVHSAYTSEDLSGWIVVDNLGDPGSTARSIFERVRT